MHPAEIGYLISNYGVPITVCNFMNLSAIEMQENLSHSLPFFYIIIKCICCMVVFIQKVNRGREKNKKIKETKAKGGQRGQEK